MNKEEKKVLIVGIKGVAMSHIAVILKKLGYEVEGADVDEHFITDPLLAQHGIKIHTHFDLEVMPDNVSHVIYGAAHGGRDNPIVKKALTNGIKIVHQSEFLGELLKEFEHVIAICGTHGKTTTSSLMAHALINLKVLPSYLIGAPSFGIHQGSDYGTKKYFVIEADEYGMNPPTDVTPKFFHLHPQYVICTNIDFDHPDVYKNLEDVKGAFSQFLRGKKIVVCFDDDPLMEVVRSSNHRTFTTYGFNEGADARIVNYKSSAEGHTFDIQFAKTTISSVHTGMSGRKNALNTAGALVMLLELGFDIESVLPALSGFIGAKRRLEVLYNNDGYTIIDDYAHHPQEIEAAINAVREQYEGRTLRVVFQPHTFSRTEALLPDFCTALSLADSTYIAPIFASAREDSSQSTMTSQLIAQGAAAQGYTQVSAYETKDMLTEQIKSEFVPGDVILIMGAGDIYKIAPALIPSLK